MDKIPPYKRLLLACLLTLLFSFTFKELLFEKETSEGFKDLPDKYFALEGYVVSKRINTIWIANEPKSIGERIIGFLTSSYGPQTTIVSKHDDVENSALFNGLKINQKVLVYGDYLRESYPGKLSAYHVEVLKSN